MSRVIIYTRLSADHAQSDSTLETQRQTCERLCATHGLEPSHYVSEGAGQSAYHQNQPKLDAVLDSLQPGDVLVAWEVSRLTRSTAYLSRLLAAMDVGVRILTPQIDTATRAGAMLLSLFGSMAKAESDDKSQRQIDSINRRRSRGDFIGHRPPFGMRLTPDRAIEPDTTTSAIAIRVIDAFLDGETYAQVAARLRGVDSTRQWLPVTISKWLKNPALCAMDIHGNVQERWTPLITVEKFRRIQAELASRNTKTKSGGVTGHKRARSLLAGLATCMQCGYSLSKDRMYYRCTARARGEVCSEPAIIRIDELDAFVTGAVRSFVAAQDAESPWLLDVADALGLVDRAPSERRAELNESAAALRTKIERVTKMWHDGVLDDDQYAEAIAGPAADERTVKAELASLPNDDVIDLTVLLDTALDIPPKMLRDLISRVFDITVARTGVVAMTDDSVTLTLRDGTELGALPAAFLPWLEERQIEREADT